MAKFLDANGLGHLWDIIKEHVSTAVATAKATIDAYTINGKKISSNPTLSKGDLGLGNVTNDAQVKRTEMGKANGVATLDSGGKVPSAQLPSYVDDVLEYASKSSFPATGETGKIYVSINDNKTWRWSGSAYVEISQGVTLGETSSTAYAGDKGAKLNALVSSIVGFVRSLSFQQMEGTYNIVVTSYGKNEAGTLFVESSVTEQLKTATTTMPGLMSQSDKAKLDGIASGANKYTLPQATASALGGVKIGYSTSGKNYAVQLDSSGKMYVSVPWTDTNTTYGVATQSANGLMSSTDKKKLDGIATGATADSALTTSEIDEVCV